MARKQKNRTKLASDLYALVGRILRENAWEYRGLYVFAIVCLLVIAVTTAFAAWIMRDVVDEIFVRRRADLIVVISATIAGAFALRGIATYFQAVTLSKIGNNLVARYQRRLFDHLMKLGLNYYADHRSGALAARINMNVNGIRDLISTTITTVARDVVGLIGLVVVMLWTDPLLSVIAFLIGPPLILTVNYIGKRVRQIQRQAINTNSRLIGAVQEATQGIAVVKAFTMEDQLSQKLGKLINEAEQRSNKIARTTERLGPISETLAGFAIAGVVAYSGFRALNGGVPPGSVFAFITAMLLAYDPARRLARVQVNLEKSMVNARMIYEILDLPPGQTDAPDAKTLAVTSGEVAFRNVSFAYVPNNPVLTDVSFVAESGKTTAIVGASGAGKSTLVSLLERFYDVGGGKILIDDDDISGVTKHSLRNAMSFVSQQPYLFEGTIRDNIRYGRPDATDTEVEEAAKLAAAHDFILEQPQGYDTPVGENGASLSGGQRQRLSIARAIVRNTPILLLDEATSALDNESEARVQVAIEHAMKGRTTIVIAHRLSTIMNADKIVVMEAGRVVEEGTHADLMAIENGVYRRFQRFQNERSAATDKVTVLATARTGKREKVKK